MQQLTLAQAAKFQRYGKKTRREQFLDEMEAVMPWSELLALVAPHYSKGEAGRKPGGLTIMLRVYFVQQWFALSDPGVEEALYESPVLRCFVCIDLGRAPAPDETTILNFRHLLEEHELCGEILDTVNHYLDSRGIRITTGTIVDATIIHAPSSTKNEKKERDPSMHQTKKGNSHRGLRKCVRRGHGCLLRERHVVLGIKNHRFLCKKNECSRRFKLDVFQGFLNNG